MASLYRDDRTGYFFAQIYDKSRRPIRKTIPLRTKHQRTASRALQRIENSIATGDLDPWHTEKDLGPSLGALGEAIEIYLASRGHLKVSTIRTYREILVAFRDHLGSRYDVSRITPADVLSWLDTTRARDVTRRKYVHHLGYFFRYLRDHGEDLEDISKLVPLRKVPESAPKAMTEENVVGLLRAIRAHSPRAGQDGRSKNFEWLALLVIANIHLGLRRGELIHLTWEHVDFDRRLLFVKNSSEFMTKSSRERTLPLCRQSQDALNQLRKQRSGRYVFHDGGRRLKPGTLTKVFQKFRRCTGLPDNISLHSTRHTFGTSLAEKGVPVTVIQTLMGHSSVTTTERYMSTRADVAEAWVVKAFEGS